MDIADIELIQSVRDAGSLSRACDRLALSQPTLSKRLARLESNLGAALFYRYSTGLVATPTAEFILRDSQRLRGQLVAIERQVALMNSLEAGQLRLGVGPIIEQLLVPQVLNRFLDSTGPAVSLSVVAEDDDTLLTLFDQSELDIIVGPFSPITPTSDHVRVFEMVSDAICAVVNAEHPLLKAPITRQESLRAYPWVAPKVQGSLRSQTAPAFLDRIKVLSDNYDSLKRLTKSSQAICVGPAAIFQQDLLSGELVRLDLDLGLTWQSALLIKRETYLAPLARHLVDLFQDASADLTADNN